MPVSLTTRSELARRARDVLTHQSTFTPQAPCDWRPQKVLDPKTGSPFTDPGAWDFVASLLESGHEVTVIAMQKPPGQLGYQMTVSGFPGQPDIYIKLTLTKHMVNGRSFHPSTK